MQGWEAPIKKLIGDFLANFAGKKIVDDNLPVNIVNVVMQEVDFSYQHNNSEM